MDYTILGLMAGALTSISLIPQALKAWKTKQTRDISLPMFVMFTAGILLWLIYGLLINDVPIIAANMVAIVFASAILFCKMKYG